MDFLNKIDNKEIYDSFIKTYPKIETKQKIVCAISGGADSDIILDILTKVDKEKKIDYVNFDTGIEYQATKEHLDYLEQKYDIKINKIKALVPVPLGCKKFGIPFWSKYASEQIERLQRHNFTWEDKPFDELIKTYPKCVSALKWWCNANEGDSQFNISHTRYLKEYIIKYPPDFKISNKCCKGAKKDNIKHYLHEKNADLQIVGIRKSEGGIRSSIYKSCFDLAKDGETYDIYRPIFWYKDDTKKVYETLFEITHSKCYTEYGLKRTGCVGCPFAKGFENELKIVQKYEPKLYNAILNIFGKSYEYTRNFYKFREEKKHENQIR